MESLNPIRVSKWGDGLPILGAPVSTCRLGPGKHMSVRLASGCNPRRSVHYDCLIIGHNDPGNDRFEEHGSGRLLHSFGLWPESSKWWPGQTESRSKHLSPRLCIAADSSKRRLVLWGHRSWGYISRGRKEQVETVIEKIFSKEPLHCLVCRPDELHSKKMKEIMIHKELWKPLTENVSREMPYKQTKWSLTQLELELEPLQNLISPREDTIMIMASCEDFENFSYELTDESAPPGQRHNYSLSSFVAVLESTKSSWKEDITLRKGDWKRTHWDEQMRIYRIMDQLGSQSKFYSGLE